MDDLNDFNAVQARQNAEESKVSYNNLLREVLFITNAASLKGERSTSFLYAKNAVKPEDLTELEAELTRREFTVSKQHQDSLVALTVSY